MALVRAKVTHTQPGTQIYRVQDEEFQHEGKLYAHVEPVKVDKPARIAPEQEAEK